jgi:uncharacterized membrane protein
METTGHTGHPMRWMWAGLGLMFVLIGVAAVVGTIYPGAPSSATPGGVPTLFADFSNLIWGLVAIFFAFWFLSWIFGVWGPMGWRRYRSRRYWGGDEYQILRERYAKGEITKDQFDQMMRDLEANDRRP